MRLRPEASLCGWRFALHCTILPGRLLPREFGRTSTEQRFDCLHTMTEWFGGMRCPSRMSAWPLVRASMFCTLDDLVDCAVQENSTMPPLKRPSLALHNWTGTSPGTAPPKGPGTTLSLEYYTNERDCTNFMIKRFEAFPTPPHCLCLCSGKRRFSLLPSHRH